MVLLDIREIWSFRPRLHEQIKPSLIVQNLEPHEVTPEEFVQIKVVLFAHVNAALEKGIIISSMLRQKRKHKRFIPLHSLHLAYYQDLSQ